MSELARTTLDDEGATMPPEMKRMLGASRQHEVLQYLRTYRTGQVSSLSELFGASESTIRRDLDALQQQGLVARVHGGAAITSSGVEAATPVRAASHLDEKARIGRQAVQEIQSGSAILISGGTTTAAMIPHLNQIGSLTVLTNSLPIATALAGSNQVEIIVFGGVLRRGEMSLLGHVTTDALAAFHVDAVFTGAYGLDPAQGLSGVNLGEVDTDRALISAGNRLFVLADSSKFGQRGPVRLISWDAVDVLITDGAAPRPSVTQISEQGVRVVQC